MAKLGSKGKIDGHDIHVEITGPEAQDLAGDERVGADVLMTRVENVLSGLKAEIEQ